jgi:O-acetyl-ADP-ribose deacetylase (regulator of RNase III)
VIVYEGQGDLFEAPQKTLVCTINVVGAMGKGIALHCKRRFPGLFEAYLEGLFHGPFGNISVKESIQVNRNFMMMWRPQFGNHNVLLFPTKLHWGNDSPLDLIEENLVKLVERYQEFGIESLALPPLGCGNGNRDYDREVKPLLYKYLDKSFPIPVGIYTGT